MRSLVPTLLLLQMAAISGCVQSTPPSQTNTSPSQAIKPTASKVSVAAAADLKYALDEVIVEFEKAHPNIDCGGHVRAVARVSGNGLSTLVRTFERPMGLV